MKGAFWRQFEDHQIREHKNPGALRRVYTWNARYLGYGRSNHEGWRAIPGYTGAAMSTDSGQTYLGARYLYRQTFTSPDPAPLDPTTPFGLNRYAYANDNPVRFIDPNGHCAKYGKAKAMCKQQAKLRRENKRIRDAGGAVQRFSPQSVPTNKRTAALYYVARYFGIDTTGVTLIYMPKWGGLAVTYANGESIYGIEAFNESFGMLGSTLMHEITVHYRMQDLSGFVSTERQALYMREVQAYDYELRPQNIQRFGLNSREVESLKRIRSRYFNALNSWRKSLVNAGIYRSSEDY